MKKIVKKLLFVVILLAVPFIIVSTNVYADINPKTYSPSGSIDSSTVLNYGSKLYQIFGLIGIIISVIALMIIGLTFIIASTTEKAEYKKHMMPIVIGIFIIASISSIVTIFANIGESFNNDAVKKVQQEEYDSFIGPRQGG